MNEAVQKETTVKLNFKPRIVNTNSASQVAIQLYVAQARCRERKLTPEDVQGIITAVESKLQLFKKDWVGFEFTAGVKFGGRIPGAYKAKGSPESTWIRVRRIKSGWQLIRAWRAECDPGDGYTIYPHYTDEQKAKIVEYHVKHF